MARPSKIPDDPKVYDKLLESLALGVPQVLIAESLEVGEGTLSSWKKKRSFKRDLAEKKLHLLQPTIGDFRARYPKEYLERHPDTKGIWGPPKVLGDLTGPALQITVNQVVLELTGRYDRVPGDPLQVTSEVDDET